jgi:hypothetical protein
MGRRIAALVLVALAAAAIANAAGSRDIYNGGDGHEGIGQGDTKALQRGTSYSASAFAVRVRIRPPASLWGGVQYESRSYRFIQLNHLPVPGAAPLAGTGYITLESAKAPTPSVAKTLANLRATPHVSFGPTRPTHVGGLRASMFDATITGSDLHGTCPGGHVCPRVVSFAPFLTNHHCGFCGDAKFDPREALDVKAAREGQLFRILVVDVRGKTVVIYVESNYPDQKKFPPARIFPTFLPLAQKMLAAVSWA